MRHAKQHLETRDPCVLPSPLKKLLSTYLPREPTLLSAIPRFGDGRQALNGEDGQQFLAPTEGLQGRQRGSKMWTHWELNPAPPANDQFMMLSGCDNQLHHVPLFN